MGHIINPISFRIRYHALWSVSWNNFLKKDYTYFFALNNTIEKILYSFTKLKCFKKRFIFFELRYFIIDQKLLLYFGFRFSKKSKLILKFLKFDNKIKESKLYSKNLYKQLQLSFLKYINKQKFLLNSSISLSAFISKFYLSNLLIKKSFNNNLYLYKLLYLFINKPIRFTSVNSSFCFNKYLLKQKLELTEVNLIGLLINKYNNLYKYKLLLKDFFINKLLK